MLGPVKTSQYSEVNWAGGSTALPEQIVQRFDGKVIAITGYEGPLVFDVNFCSFNKYTKQKILTPHS